MANQNHENSTANHVVDQLDADDAEFSDLGDSLFESDYTSLSSSLADHVYENGRRYHSLNAGAYVMPNDENEQERLDMVYHCISLLLGGALHVVSLPKNLHRILDCGTGTGIWAIDMADAHPEATVIGVDLSPIQPKWVPPNCTFEVDDLEKPWLWKEPFDFIYSANLAQGIRDWPAYTKHMFDNLSPGGVVQLYESEMTYRSDDDTLPKEGALELYQRLFREAGAVVGLKDVCNDLEGHLLNAGFVDVKVVVKKVPTSPWPKDPKKKEIGRWFLEFGKDGFRSYGANLFTKVLGKSTDEAAELCDAGFAELIQRGAHGYLSQYFVEGRKPLVT